MAPYSIAGVFWYQGEGNAQRAYLYRKVLPHIIGDWRGVWEWPELPFLVVQLPGYEQKYAPSGAWAVLREAQLQALKLPNCGLVVTIDVGDPHDIHPADKLTVGNRLARAALGFVYKQPGIVPFGPIFDSMEIKNGSIRLQFQHAGSGLTGSPDGRVAGFTVAGRDHKFVAAEARIEGGSVIVSSAVIADPIAARYGWADNPVCTLRNREGLPASPFRTDDWEVPTQVAPSGTPPR